MFSQVFVCPLGEGVGFVGCNTGHMTWGGLPMGGSVSSGSASGRGAASRGRVEQTPLDLPTGGLHPAGCRVHEILRGYGQQAGGTHPTGMLSF